MNHPNPLSNDLGENDVLLGRGTGPNENIGNARFRTLVAEVLQASTNNLGGAKKETHLEGQQKSALALKVLRAITVKGGRFVKKYPIKKCKGRHGKNKNAYVEVPVHVAVEKTKQTIRYILDLKKPISCPADCSKSSQNSFKTMLVDNNYNNSVTDKKKSTMFSFEDSALTAPDFSEHGCANSMMNKKTRPFSSMCTSKNLQGKTSHSTSPFDNGLVHMTKRSDIHRPNPPSQLSYPGRKALPPPHLLPDTAATTVVPSSSSPNMLRSSYALDEALRVLQSYSSAHPQPPPPLFSDRLILPDLSGGIIGSSQSRAVDSQDPMVTFSLYHQLLPPSYSFTTMQPTCAARSFEVATTQPGLFHPTTPALMGMAGITSLMSSMVPVAPHIGGRSLLDIAIKLRQDEEDAKYFPYYCPPQHHRLF